MSIVNLDGFTLNGTDYNILDKLAQSRIDNLISNNNLTEGNSELIDIRVGWDGTAYTSAGAAVREQVRHLNESISILYQRRIIGDKASSCNNLIANYDEDGVMLCYSDLWHDLPNNTSCIMMNQRYSTNYKIQIAINVQTGIVFNRVVNIDDHTVYRDWVEGSISSVVEEIKEKVSNLPQYRSVSGLSVACERLTSRIIEEGFYSLSSSDWDDFPMLSGGVLLVVKYSPNYILQVGISIKYNVVITRIVNKNTFVIFRDWCGVDGIQPIKILCVGDSIAYGARNSKKGFIGDLGLPYKNNAKAGATLSTRVTSVINIPTQLENETDYIPDIVISNGGVNDYYTHAPLGDIPISPVTNEEDAATLDLTTALGGLQKLFWIMITKYPKSQRFFLITHKTKAHLSGSSEKVEWATTPNNEGYTFDDLHDAIVKVCNLYNVKVIDVYKESMINTAFDCYVSPIDYNDDNSITNSEFVDNDRIHPLAYGYKHGYVPLVKQALQIGTVK